MANNAEERRARRMARRQRRGADAVEEVEEVAEEVAGDADDDDMPEEFKEDEKDVPVVKEAPAPGQRRQRRAVAQSVEDVAEEEASAGSFSLDALLQKLDDGQSLTVTRTGIDSYVVRSGVEIPVAPTGKGGRLPANFWESLQTDEYNEWRSAWQEKTYEEKVAHAKKAKITWDVHEDERIDHMRVTAAVWQSMGIEKYKPEYDTQAARKEAKTRAKAGLPW